jgi:hypothetical protein
LVDCKNKRLLDRVTSLSAPAQTDTSLISSLKFISGGTLVDSLLSEFPDLTRRTWVQREVRNNTVHHIRPSRGPPVTCRPRRLAPDRLTIAISETPCCGTAQLAASKVLCPPHYTSYVSYEEHEHHLRSLLPASEVRDSNEPAKCLSSIRGHLFRLQSVHRGFRPLDERMAHLQDCPLPKPPVSSTASWTYLNFTGDFFPTALLSRQNSTKLFPAPKSGTFLPSPGCRIGPSKSARRVCHAPLYWRTPIHHRRLHFHHGCRAVATC